MAKQPSMGRTARTVKGKRDNPVVKDGPSRITKTRPRKPGMGPR